MPRSRRRHARRLFAVVAAMLAMALLVPGVAADDISESKGFRKAVTLAGIREHQAAFQAIADANDGTRASGTPGYDASAQYVFDRLAAAGYDPEFQEFEFPFFQILGPSTLERLAPTERTYVEGQTADYSVMTYSAGGDVSAGLSVVDTDGSASLTNTSGCEEDDFDGFPAGNIALMQRGTCTFAIKAANAEAAGAAGAIVFNNGTPADRVGVVLGTLGAPGVAIPVVGLSYPLGVELVDLVAGGPVTMHLAVQATSEIRTTVNVIAETDSGSDAHVVVVGAHLDSRLEGPGINDNGSGSATILEIAEVFADQDREARNKLRFMWFGAEEFNLLGSGHYVANLSDEEIEDIELMLNFDMVGSLNFVRFVYDGDNSDTVGAVGPPGSAHIEEVFLDYFESQGLPVEPTAFSGRSDYGPFIAPAVGIPAGGLFTGAEGIKTADEAALYGGTAGMQYDPCYHLACDTYDNNSDIGLDQMADAAAHAVLTFSRTRIDVDESGTDAATGVNKKAKLDFKEHAEDKRSRR